MGGYGDDSDHRHATLLDASRLTDENYLQFLTKEFGLSDDEVAAMLWSVEEGQG